MEVNGNFVQTKYLSTVDFSGTRMESDSEELKFLFEQIDKILKENYGVELKKNAISVNLLISDISKFGEINSVYSQYFGLKPPVRACVSVPRRENQPRVQVQVIFSKDIND